MSDTNPYRERKLFGVNKIIWVGIAVAIYFPIFNSMLALRVYASLFVMTVVWILLVRILGLFAKKSRLNVYHEVDDSVIARTKKELAASREKQKKDASELELAMLNEGKPLPVLDSWRINSEQRRIHPFFGNIVHCVLDPASKELHLCVSIGTMEMPADGDVPRYRVWFKKRIQEFLKLAAQSGDALVLKNYFGTLVLQCDALREDERGYDVPFPVFSMEMSADKFWKLGALESHVVVEMERIADVRFADAKEIVPHREMKYLETHGGK